MAALADFGGKTDRGLGRRATADVLWDQVSKILLKPTFEMLTLYEVLLLSYHR